MQAHHQEVKKLVWAFEESKLETDLIQKFMTVCHKYQRIIKTLNDKENTLTILRIAFFC
jgi:hypothetical protein